jgi:hypothetical protein
MMTVILKSLLMISFPRFVIMISLLCNLLQAMQEPEKPDFDYDAHIAMLIARSEGLVTGEQGPRGWEKEEDDEDEDVSSYEGSAGDESCLKSRPAVGVSSDYLKRIEEQFEITMEDYGDENIGDLEDEVEDEDMQGTIDFNDPDNALESALDEFLQVDDDPSLPLSHLDHRNPKTSNLRKESSPMKKGLEWCMIRHH